MDSVNKKAKVFLGSSTEGKRYAEALVELLRNTESNFEIIPWYNEDFFGLSEFTLSVLEARANEFSFGIFIMSPDDLSDVRGSTYKVTRDNVIFELGLFIGKIGINRCFFVTPEDKEYKSASDLSGLTSGRFNPSTGNDGKALSPFANQIKNKINEITTQQAGNLSGIWSETWYAEGSQNFPIENPDDQVTLIHEGDIITAEFTAGDLRYRLEGKKHRDYIIGHWYDITNESGYRGSFQLRISRMGKKMEGIYTGNRESSSEIGYGKWVWTKAS